MSVLSSDLAGLAASTMIAFIVAFPAGWALTRGVRRLGLDLGEGVDRLAWSGVVAVTVLPAFDDLIIRAVGVPGAAIGHLALGLCGLASVRVRRPGRIATSFALIWWAIVAIAFVDVEVDGGLYQSLATLDLVKHAAVIDALIRDGLPLHDPFFARSEAAGYYDYYYFWPAMTRWLGGRWVDSRVAFAATAFWAGIAWFGLLWLVARAAGLIRRGRGRRFALMLLLLSFVGGLDLIGEVPRILVGLAPYAQADLWNEELRFPVTSLLWVPHHVCAVAACWAAFLFVEQAATSTGRLRWLASGLAGAALASAFGMSVWVALTAVPIVGSWAGLLAWRRDRARLGALAIAGSVALVLAAAQIVDILQGRGDGGSPVGLAVRPFLRWAGAGDPISTMLLALSLPVNYALELGLFALGSALFLAHRRAWPVQSKPMRDLLFLSAAVSLLVGGFLRSTIINNDLGWRSVLFAELAAILWTTAIAQSASWAPKRSPAVAVTLTLGFAATLWDVVGFRGRPPSFAVYEPALNAAPRLDAAERRAYRWVATHLPPRAVLQPNPAKVRQINVGLYSERPVGVIDREATLFGASRAEVTARIRLLQPVFETGVSAAAAARLLRVARADAVVLTSADPAWRSAGGVPVGWRCAYREPMICLATTSDLAR